MTPTSNSRIQEPPPPSIGESLSRHFGSLGKKRLSREEWLSLPRYRRMPRKAGATPYLSATPNPELLEFLFQQGDETLLRREAEPLKIRQSWADGLTLAGDTLKHLGAQRELIDTIKRYSEMLIKIKPDPRFHPRQHYWAGALVPYLNTVIGKTDWHWLTAWNKFLETPQRELSALVLEEMLEQHHLEVTAPRDWTFLKSAMPDRKTFSIKQSVIAEAVLSGIENTVHWMRGSRILRNTNHYRGNEVLGLHVHKGHAVAPNPTIETEARRMKGSTQLELERAYYEKAILLFPGLKMDLHERLYK